MAQTVAYAHVRAVIHRDLKSSNVMVGSFDEVQVNGLGPGQDFAARRAVQDWAERLAEQAQAGS